MAEQAQVALNFCVKHPDEEKDLYCKFCKTSTCNECLKTDHVGHDFDTIAKLYRKINNGRSEIISDIEAQIASKCSHNKQHLLEVKRRNDNSLKANTANIEKKRLEIQRIAGEILTSHAQLLNSRDEKLRKQITQKEDAFIDDESAVLQMIETFKTTTMKGLDLIEYYEKLKSKVRKFPMVDVSHCYNAQVYVASEINRDTIQVLTGKVREYSRRRYNIKQIGLFQQRTSDAHTICPLTANEAWITYKDANKFELIRRDGHRLKKVKKDTHTHSFVVQNDSFLLCNRDEKSIIKINMSGKKSTWKNTSPLFPGFIGHALQDNILITLADDHAGIRTKESQRKVQLVTSIGIVLNTYEYGEDGTTPVLTRPGKVTQNYNSDVCVVNKYEIAKGEWRGSICLFHENGGFKCVYNGYGGEFHPWGICCDSMCNIICANRFDSTIHIISSEGSFLEYLFTSDTCLPYPTSLAIHEGILWMGCGGGEVLVYEIMK